MLLRLLIAGAVALALGLAGCGGDSDDEPDGGKASPDKPLPLQANLLFTIRGDATATENTLEVETDKVEWFTDRPKRQAGIAGIDQLVEKWNAYGFESVPPNAAITGDDTDVVVELTNPEATENGIAFSFKPIRGEVPSETEPLSIYIDTAEYKTSLHMNVQLSDSFCPNRDDQLWNPQVAIAPSIWYQQPADHVQLSRKSQQVFSGASNSSTRINVEYDLVCAGDGQRIGNVTLSGSVVETGILGVSNNARCDVSPDSLISAKNTCNIYGYTDGQAHPQITVDLNTPIPGYETDS